MRELPVVAKSDEKTARQKMKLRIPRGSGLTRLILGPTGRIVIILFALFVIAGLGTFTFFYARYARIIDERLRAGVFANSAKIFAAPESVSVGDTMSPSEIATDLRRSGYTESRGNPVGYYQIHSNSIEIFPQSDSYFDQEPGLIRFANGKISQIVSLQDNTARNQYQLEPQLLQAVSGAAREKRRMVKFHDIPKVLVDAVTSIEDKRFFQHAGFDPIRILKAVYVDVREGRKDQGASTLSMQTARMFFLTQDKSFKRKAAEVIITLQLEQKLSKEEIFEYYANQVDLGWRGTFHIVGLGQASEAYLGKELNSITLPEAAEIAGMIQRPGYFDPFRHPDRLRDRRNIVLQLMRQNNVISDRDYALATEAPLTVTKTGSTSVEAPYFVDMVNDKLQNMFQDADFQSNAFRIYTTIDMRLQHAAVEAVRLGMAGVDEQIKKQRRFRGQTPPTPQVALVAMDPHTGEVKALVGGRNYGLSQLTPTLAKRQPGSIFKPFVYATALDTAVSGGPRVLTASTTVVDEPTTFYFDNQIYEPGNFEKKFYGTVTLRDALAHSLNVATVKVGQMVGFDAVVNMANRAGMNYKIQPTPAVALGAYEITPLEATGAYTIFANGGDYLKPSFLSMVRAQDGRVVFKNKVEEKQVLDPRVAYLTTSLLEEVLRSGTAAGVRARFNLTMPAAGKTGTSHDGWFAGYTSELLCVVWVGFDDNRTIDLEGAHSAAPIWAEFMRRALAYREYRDVKPFRAPAGIVAITIDPESGMPAAAACPKTRAEVYIAGTEPVGVCPLHGGRGGSTTVAGWDISPPPATPPAGRSTPTVTGSQGDSQVPPDPASRRAARQAAGQMAGSAAPPPVSPKDEPKKKAEKKGILQRLWRVFK
ncbi:MAG: PBP1A family penicillin-binding protein [Candidatus Solibacter sp.]|nr:PBP1A family penicillin-binding protein [Candidatus Solibacter sp.]